LRERQLALAKKRGSAREQLNWIRVQVFNVLHSLGADEAEKK
jgi:hypothetical protein